MKMKKKERDQTTGFTKERKTMFIGTAAAGGKDEGTRVAGEGNSPGAPPGQKEKVSALRVVKLTREGEKPIPCIAAR